MLSAFKQKILFRVFLVFCLICFLSVFVYAYYSEPAGPAAYSTAPFYDEFVGGAAMEARRGEDLTRAHRTLRELQNWLSLAVSESLMLDSRNFEKQLDGVNGYYSEDGYEQLKNYLVEAGLKSNLQQNDLKVSVIVEQPPLLLNEGVVGSSYRWLFQMPVTISYLPRRATEYQPGDQTSARQLTIRAQVGRYAMTQQKAMRDLEAHGLKIESFAVLARRD